MNTLLLPLASITTNAFPSDCNSQYTFKSLKNEQKPDAQSTNQPTIRKQSDEPALMKEPHHCASGFSLRSGHVKPTNCPCHQNGSSRSTIVCCNQWLNHGVGMWKCGRMCKTKQKNSTLTFATRGLVWMMQKNAGNMSGVTCQDDDLQKPIACLVGSRFQDMIYTVCLNGFGLFGACEPCRWT